MFLSCFLSQYIWAKKIININERVKNTEKWNYFRLNINFYSKSSQVHTESQFYTK